MVEIKIGGKADVQKIHRLVQQDEILVGYPDGVQHPDSKMQNIDLARALHHGTAHIPSRPFLYQAIFSVRGELQKLIRETFAKRVKENREPSGRFSPEGIGAFLVGAVQRFVRSDYYKNTAPNAPATIARKGSDTPLIDTGFMVNSTVYVTRKHPPKTTVKKIEVSG
jgi:hypothetical protein